MALAYYQHFKIWIFKKMLENIFSVAFKDFLRDYYAKAYTESRIFW